MKKLTITLSLLVISVLCNRKVSAGNLPGPMVYVVTPATRSAQNDEGRARPFYYRNWIRRMDSETSTTTAAPTTSTVKVDTPDLIFAEFESDGHMKKSIRKLLEKERVETKTSTTFQPIYVPDENFQPVAHKTNYGLPLPTEKPDQKETEESKYFEMYNKFYNIAPTAYTQTTSPTTTTTRIPTTISTQATPTNVEDIWHIIDSEKSTQHSGNWEEVPIETNEEESKNETQSQTNTDDHVIEEDNKEDNEDDDVFTDFAVPGFSANPGNGAENESRGIRTESNFRFPYVNLKPFQIKTMKKPTNNLLSNSKKNNNLFTNLDNFYDLKNPVRGEAQDIVPQQNLIDRYNPAQPYLPQQSYGSNSKESNNVAKATANLVPPPPPQAPKITDNDFPSPTNYESFPPYAPLSFNNAPQLLPPAPPPSKPVSNYSPPAAGPLLVSSYTPPASGPLSVSSYSPPAPGPLPVSSYSPPAPPGDSGDSDTFDSPPGPPMDHGDSDSIYSAPSSPEDSGDSDLLNGHGEDMDLGYRYKPASGPPQSFAPTAPPMPAEPPMPPMPIKPFEGYNYNKPFMPPDSDMPDHDIKPDFHGFYDDKPDDFHYHHHHHPTTTTTEMPRVNRYSYYYLGKKLYYLPLYFSVYFIVYVGALIVKAVLRHKIVYPNSWKPNDTTAGFFSKRSIDSWDLSNENLHEVTGKVTHAIATAAKMYMDGKDKNE